MKKILSAVLTAVLIFSPIGNVVFHDNSTQWKQNRTDQVQRVLKVIIIVQITTISNKGKRLIPIQPIDLQRLQTQNVDFSQVAG